MACGLSSPPSVRVSVVLPTFNERENVGLIATQLLGLKTRFQLELLFVDDDSTDGTADAVRQLARVHEEVRLILRVGRSGLSSAIKEGILDASGDVVVVMDCDGQHDPAAVERAIDSLLENDADLVVGSRFLAGAAIHGLSPQRERNSNLANAVARFSLPGYRQLTDSMSGFFALRPERCLPFVRQVDVNGFKFLYELLSVSGGRLSVSEVPLVFQPRVHGSSKLNLAVIWDLGVSIVHTLLLRAVPRRAVSFALVGCFGIGVHLLMFALCSGLFRLTFEPAQGVAVVIAASCNYLVNNLLTFRAQKLRGWALVAGLLRFLLVASFGMTANVGVSSAFYHQVSPQPLLAMLAGIAVDFVWKYAASSRFVWNCP
jgi:dolichol-phosphate mannosyltransferase